MQETQVWSLSREDPLVKEMATHSSFLACGKFHVQEKPGGLPSVGLQSVRHDWAHAHTDVRTQLVWRPQPRGPETELNSRLGFAFRALTYTGVNFPSAVTSSQSDNICLKFWISSFSWKKRERSQILGHGPFNSQLLPLCPDQAMYL